ncbi:MAG: hexokinase [Selenomonadaceae bacterium]|nr:hexokinase [Selenomonadaceae bacterium]
MAFNEEQFKEIIAEFTIDTERLQTIAASFRQDLQLGLRDITLSSMRMLKSYVGLPSGKETGEYLALDFGGTNVRVFKIRLDGDGKFEIIKRVGRPLIVPGEYDYICKDATAEQMFDFIAELIDEAIDGDHQTKYYLGHTFSFPSTQDNLYNARLIIWTKEFATQGVEGQVANDLLVEALKRRGAGNVVPVAVLNDTVAVLLSAAYKTPNIFIGSIYATGHNTCYLEPSIHDPNGVGLGGMILNLECGNFMKLIPNRFDREYDEGSEKPGEQRFEKMVSGRYMGELLGMAIAELLGEKGKKYGLTSVDMSMMILDRSTNLIKASDIIMAKVGRELDFEDVKKIRELASAIVIRSARLVAASFVAIIWQRAGSGKIEKQHVAVDGSVYEKMPLAKENIVKAMAELLEEDSAQVDTILDNGGSGLGAAIAAAMAVNKD